MEELLKINKTYIYELLQDIDYHIKAKPFTISKDFLLKLSNKIENILEKK